MENEFLYMQKLAGLITESEYKAKLNEESNNIADFLNQHKDEAFEKMLMPTLNYFIEDGDINPEDITNFDKTWKFIKKDTDKYSPYEHAELTLMTPDVNHGVHASFSPFPDDPSLDINNPGEEIVGGKKIYYFEYSF